MNLEKDKNIAPTELDDWIPVRVAGLTTVDFERHGQLIWAPPHIYMGKQLEFNVTELNRLLRILHWPTDVFIGSLRSERETRAAAHNLKPDEVSVTTQVHAETDSVQKSHSEVDWDRSVVDLKIPFQEIYRQIEEENGTKNEAAILKEYAHQVDKELKKLLRKLLRSKFEYEYEKGIINLFELMTETFSILVSSRHFDSPNIEIYIQLFLFSYFFNLTLLKSYEYFFEIIKLPEFRFYCEYKNEALRNSDYIAYFLHKQLYVDVIIPFFRSLTFRKQLVRHRLD